MGGAYFTEGRVNAQRVPGGKATVLVTRSWPTPTLPRPRSVTEALNQQSNAVERALVLGSSMDITNTYQQLVDARSSFVEKWGKVRA